MAIYHFSAKIISRANGSSALAAAAYRSASRLHDERLGRTHDFSNKAGVVHSEVLLPDGAPEAWRDREALWNAVEAAELRKDAQLAREIEFALPRELAEADCVEIARSFVKREFVDRGMVADLNVHWDRGADGEAKPHAHVMLSTRSVVGEGADATFGPKVREWNATHLLEHWREAWADHLNRELAERDIDARVDHRTLEAQGIDLEPQGKIGPAASRMVEQGLLSERLEEHHAIARANGEKLLANPGIALDAITQTQATFTTRDLARFVHRHSEGKDQFDQVMGAVRAAPDLVELGKDGRGETRFTSRQMIETERRLERAADSLSMRHHHGLPAAASLTRMATAGSGWPELGVEQQAALRHITERSDLAIVIGYAGTGKSTMLGEARDQWERVGYEVRGAALSGVAAENLEGGSGIASRTIASLEHQWKEGRELLTNRSVLVIDEAGMIGSRQMERIVSEVEKRGAKLVLVGDPQQLQAIEAGAAFRGLAERHGAMEITTVRRQREDWQRDATRDLATGRTREAIAAYAEQGCVHAAETRDQARSALVDRWDSDRRASPDASRIILTHTNDEVLELNRAARARLQLAGALGEDVELSVERGNRSFASGDRVMFLQNERSLGVKNGTLGTVQSVSQARMAVMLDDGRSVGFDLKDYAHLDHGYAATIHKAQGMTVDRVHVLASPGLDAHASYVALSRHRDRVDLHYGQDDFADQGKLVRTLGRERGKDLVSDYTKDDRRAPEPASPKVEVIKPAPQRSIFAGLKISPAALSEPQPASPLERAVERHARTVIALLDKRSEGRTVLPHEKAHVLASRKALDTLRPGSSRPLELALVQDPALRAGEVRGRGGALLNALTQMETETARQAARDAALSQRADRFVAEWKSHVDQIHHYRESGERWRGDPHLKAMESMVKELHRDPQLESFVAIRAKRLALDKAAAGASIAREMEDWIGRARGRGLGR